MASLSIAIPSTVSMPAHAALSAAQRFDTALTISAPLPALERALADGAALKAEAARAMRQLRQLIQQAKREERDAAKAAAKYRREAVRLEARRAADQSKAAMQAHLKAVA